MVAKHCRTLASDGAILLNVVGIAFWSSDGGNPDVKVEKPTCSIRIRMSQPGLRVAERYAQKPDSVVVPRAIFEADRHKCSTITIKNRNSSVRSRTFR